MAHIIARSPRGPRGRSGGGSNSYDNLILLCPNCHKEIDQAGAEAYPVEMLKRWKSQHEKMVQDRCAGEAYNSLRDMARAVQKLLITNHQVWEEFGPESKEAKSNPTSNLVEIWKVRKLAVMVPNHQKIINIFEKNAELVSADDWRVFRQFCEHAAVFERNCYNRTEGAKLFPKNFQNMVDKHAR
ncbi:MAG: HNH endonuclease [Alphaproteobacteria bacterium]|nr:HNH endonuclease [Alphaproteobacteria bacterium]